MLRLVQALQQDFSSSQSRFNYLNFFLSNLPGEFGIELRSSILPRFFYRAGKGVRVLQGARFNGVKHLEVGEGVIIGIDNFFQASAGLTIGDHTMTGPGVKIWTINHRTDSLDMPVQSQGYVRKPVEIGANVWLGANVFVMPGVHLPDGCIVSAGSVVGVKRYPPYTVIAGNPARVIAMRRPKEDEETGCYPIPSAVTLTGPACEEMEQTDQPQPL